MEDELTLSALRMALVAARGGAGPGASFRSRLAVRQQRLHGSAQRKRHRDQHVAQRQSVGQRGLRIVHENAEVRRGAPQRIPRSGRGAALRSASFWKRSTTRSGCTPRSATCRRRSSKPISPHNKRRPLRGSFLYEFSKASGNLSIRWRRRPCGQRPRSSSG